MKRKIIGIFVCMLIIATSLTASGFMNFQTTLLENENNSTRIYQYTPANSPSLINIKFVAKVVDVYDPDNLLAGGIKVNDTVKGKYTYDSSAIDSEPDPKDGVYFCNSSPCGIEVKAGELVFKTNPNNVSFVVFIGNDIEVMPSYVWDIYKIASFNNLNLSNGIEILDIFWMLFDESCTALSSDALPTKAPVLSKWNQSYYGLIIRGYDPNGSMFLIKAEVTEVTKISRARDGQFITPRILLWLLERFKNMVSIIKTINEIIK